MDDAEAPHEPCPGTPLGAWYAEADIPGRLEDGTWIDYETGHTFDEWRAGGSRAGRAPARLRPSSLTAREVAKGFGGKALKGSMRQKAWAEEIRSKVLRSVSEEAALMLATHGLMGGARFWIENREKAPKAFVRFAIEQRRLFAAVRRYVVDNEQSQDLSIENRCRLDDEAKPLREAYNELTAAWGFR